MGPFGDEHELSFEDYLSPFAPPTSLGRRPESGWLLGRGPVRPGGIDHMPPATEVGEVDSGRDLEAAESDHIPKASSTDAGGAAEQDEFASDLPPSAPEAQQADQAGQVPSKSGSRSRNTAEHCMRKRP